MRFRRAGVLALQGALAILMLAACGGPGGTQPEGDPGDQTVDLTIEVEGPGTVVIAGLDFDCSDECSVSVAEDIELTLEARPDSGKGFAGWQNACSGREDCTVQVNTDMTVKAIFADHMLDLDISGDGSGSVRIVPPDMTCSTDCSVVFGADVNASLTVSSADGSSVESWGGECSGTSGRYCQISISGLTNVSVSIIHPPVVQDDSYQVEAGTTLNVSAADGVLGNDSDTSGDSLSAELVSGPSSGNLDLNSNGSFTYTAPVGSAGSDSFSYRAVDDSGNTSATATVSLAITTPQMFVVDVNVTGAGFGNVTSSPGGIDCPGGSCSSSFANGTEVTLTAEQGIGSSFEGWGGACSGSDTTCTFTISEGVDVSARFRLDFFDLTYSRNGPGTLAFDPTGEPCGTNCLSYPHGKTVLITAEPGPDAQLSGWTGECSGSSGTACEVTVEGNLSVGANFQDLPEYTLTVNLAGDGQGTVTSTPAGIDCSTGGNGSCTATFTQGTTVDLAASASGESTFGGWAGACEGDDCSVTMNGDRTVSATFSPPETFTLTVIIGGDGAGTVTSNVGDINCTQTGGTCSHTYTEGTSVDLTATASGDSTFEGWSGAGCEGTGGCTVTMNENRNVTAAFGGPEPPEENTLTVNLAGDGSGTVVSSPAGVDCRASSCSADFPEDETVELTATPDDGSTFEGWSGACSGTDGCSVDMNENREVTATFGEPEPTSFALAIDPVPSNGTVTGGGVQCGSNGSDCNAMHAEGSTVSLTANPDDGYDFDQWTAAPCEGEGTSCKFEMTEEVTLSATFTAVLVPLLVEVTGSGTVASVDGSISDCSESSGTCSEDYEVGSEVVLTATPNEGSDFESWSNCDATDGSECTVEMAEERTVGATFVLSEAVLTVAFAGDGAGTINLDPPDVDCSEECQEPYAPGDAVTLQATADEGSEFAGWADACEGASGNSCELVMEEDQRSVANFALDAGSTEGM